MNINSCVRSKQIISNGQCRPNRRQLTVRVRIKNIFRMIKQQFGFVKTRYQGLAINRSQVNMLIGLANIYMLPRKSAS